jgi:putative oxidoreductase
MFQLHPQESWKQWAPLCLRLAIGVGFIVHGYAKLSRGPENFAAVLEWMHVPFPHAIAWLVTLTELFGGIAILLGAFVLLVSIPLIVIHLVAIFGVHWQYGFSSVRTVGLTAAGPQFAPPGYEINLLYIAGLVALMLGGAGIWSIDHAINRKRN